MMSTKDNLEREATSASEKLHDAGETIRSSAKGAAEDAKSTASAYAEQGKTAAATGLTDFASAVRRASDELQDRDQGLAAKLVSQAASSLEDVASSVSGSSLDDVMHSVQGFARRNPAAFVVGAVLAGVALGRFARASGERDHGRQVPPPSGYRPPVTPASTGTTSPGGTTSPRAAVAPSNTTKK